MNGTVEVGNGVIAPVCRQEILYQVVGADAEEIGLSGQFFRHENRGRRFNHHPQLRHSERHALGRQIGSTAL